MRQLVRRDIGVDVCRQAVVDFATQMDAAFGTASAEDDDGDDTASHASERPAPGQKPRVPELDAFLDGFNHAGNNGTLRPRLSTTRSRPRMITRCLRRRRSRPHRTPAEAPADEDANETELSLDNLDSDSPATPVRDVEEIYDLPPLDEVMAKSTLLARSASQPAPVYREPEPIRFVEPEPVVTPAIDDAYQPEPADTADHFPVQEVVEELATTEPYVPVDDAPLFDAPAPVIEDEPAESMAASAHVAALTPSAPEPVAVEPPEPAAPEAAASADTEAEAGPDKDSASSRRRKRQQQKSARARKDKLRSTTADQKTPPPPVPVPEPARPASPTGWLVSPQRAAQFEAPVPVPMPAPRPIVRRRRRRFDLHRSPCLQFPRLCQRRSGPCHNRSTRRASRRHRGTAHRPRISRRRPAHSRRRPFSSPRSRRRR